MCMVFRNAIILCNDIEYDRTIVVIHLVTNQAIFMATHFVTVAIS